MVLNSQLTTLADQHATEDLIGVTPSSKALTEFICTCETPMTIAIQGDWGTGKTSLMRMVEKELSPEAAVERGSQKRSARPKSTPADSCVAARNPEELPPLTVWFDTWHFGVYGSATPLALVLLREVIEAIKNTKDRRGFRRSWRTVQRSADAVLESLSDLSSALLSAGTSAAITASAPHLVAPIAAAAGVTEVGSAFRRRKAAKKADRAHETLKQLKKQFQRVLNDLDRKVVVFVDDLDRLSAEQSLNMMEAMKVFLDVRGVVFVLAVDFEALKAAVTTVKGGSLALPSVPSNKGIESAPGNGSQRRDIQTAEAERWEEKARAYFDKLIQVPYRLPTGKYELQGLLGAAWDSKRIPTDEAVALIQASIGANPRSIKRLVNALSLQQLIQAREQEPKQTHEQESAQEHRGGSVSCVSPVQTLCVLCLQAAYPGTELALRTELQRSLEKEPESPTKTKKQGECDAGEGIEEFLLSVASGAEASEDESQVSPELDKFLRLMSAHFKTGEEASSLHLLRHALDLATTTSTKAPSEPISAVRTSIRGLETDLQSDGVAPEVLKPAMSLVEKLETDGLEIEPGANPRSWYVKDPEGKRKGGRRVGQIYINNSSFNVSAGTFSLIGVNPDSMGEELKKEGSKASELKELFGAAATKDGRVVPQKTGTFPFALAGITSDASLEELHQTFKIVQGWVPRGDAE